MARVDPHDVRRGAVLGALRPIEVELLLERLVRQQRRHRHAPAMLGGELVRPVRGAAEEDPEAPRREGNDVRVGNLEVLALVREALVPERGEEQVDRLLVARPRVLVERNPGLLGDPPVAAADAPLVPSAGEDVGHRDRPRRAPSGCGTAARGASSGSGCSSCAARPPRRAPSGARRSRTWGRRSARSTRNSRSRGDRRSRSARGPPRRAAAGSCPRAAASPCTG